MLHIFLNEYVFAFTSNYVLCIPRNSVLRKGVNTKLIVIKFFPLDQVIRKIADSTYRMPKPAKVPEKLYAIMLKCWSHAPEERPTFETLAWQLKDFFQDDKQYKEAEEVNKLRR